MAGKKEWWIINFPEMDTRWALKGSWLSDTGWAVAGPMDIDEAEEHSDVVLESSMLDFPKRTIDDVHAVVNDVYTLYDEGYIDNDHALEAVGILGRCSHGTMPSIECDDCAVAVLDADDEER